MTANVSAYANTSVCQNSGKIFLLRTRQTVMDLWEWAIALHGRVLVPLGWLQVIFPGHGFKCQ
jgi:hypothetical protein